MKSIAISRIKSLLLLSLLFFIGCSEDQKIDAIQVEEVEGTVDAKLVGKWIGQMNGDLGADDITITLVKDGSISTTSSTDLYCTLNGTWEVLGKNFEAKGEDGCDGTIMNLTAPNSTVTLAGGWSKADGSKGTFSVDKE